MLLKLAEVRTFLEDYFSELKMALQPENKRFYDKFNGAIPIEELLSIKYFKNRHVEVSQLVNVISKSKEFIYDAEKRTFTLPASRSPVCIDDQSLLFAGIESSNFPTINRDIKWYIAKLTGVFPKFTELVTSRVFGESNFIGKIVFENEAAASEVHSFFGSQTKWDEEKIEESRAFFESKTWKFVNAENRNRYVERLMNHKEDINKYIICLRYNELALAYPPNLVVHLHIENTTKSDICAWFTEICKFIFSEYEDDDFRVLLKNYGRARELLVAKHMWDNQIVKFAVVDDVTERRMWAKCIETEKEKNRM